MTEPDLRRCACGCTVEHHRHLRDGTDCGQCGHDTCPAWRPVGPLPIHGRRAVAVAIGVPSLVVSLLAVLMFAGDWAVYTVLIVIAVLAVVMVSGPDRDSS